MTVLGLIDVLGGCTENRNVVLVKLEGEIVRDLAAHGDNDSVPGVSRSMMSITLSKVSSSK